MLAMTADDSAPKLPATNQPRDRKLTLLGFAVRALRVTASTMAVVALLRQEWVAGVVFAIVWLLILGAPRLFPLLKDPADAL